MLLLRNRQKDRQAIVILQDSQQAAVPFIKVTLSFLEFLSKHQIPVYSINFFVRYSQFQISATRVGTPIYDHAYPNIFQSTFNFNEFVSTSKKSDFFIILFQRYSLHIKSGNLIYQEHFGTHLRKENFPRFFQLHEMIRVLHEVVCPIIFFCFMIEIGREEC